TKPAPVFLDSGKVLFARQRVAARSAENHPASVLNARDRMPGQWRDVPIYEPLPARIYSKHGNFVGKRAANDCPYHCVKAWAIAPACKHSEIVIHRNQLSKSGAIHSHRRSTLRQPRLFPS